MVVTGCSQFGTRLRAYLDGELERAETDRVREHLAGCASCRSALAALAEVSRLAGVLPAEVEPPPHFGASLQVRLAAHRPDRSAGGKLPRRRGHSLRRLRWSRRYSLAGVTVAGTVLALILGAPPRIRAQDLVGKVQESWSRLQSYSCRFQAEGIVAGWPRRFEQKQWFCKPNLFRLETNKHNPEQTFIEADQVTTSIPGADWRGKRVAITRPRHAREEGLPFPFGAEWPASFEITMQALVHELRAQQGGELIGTEGVLGKPCHVLKFYTHHPGDRLPTHYLVWVDQESFLPLRVKTYRDSRNQTVSTAVDLQTNGIVPADTFHFQPRPDTFRVYGEVEPFVFALPLDRPRSAAFDRDPAGSAREEMRRRIAALPFRPLAPAYLPPGYVLVRVRAARDRWLDAYWLHTGTGAVIKLLEQSPGGEPGREAARDRLPGDESVRIKRTGEGTGQPPLQARWAEVRRPVVVQYGSWDQGGTHLSLAAAGMEREEALRIASSLTPVDDEPYIRAAKEPHR